MRAGLLLVLTLLASLAPPVGAWAAGATSGEWVREETFTINAQYRGAVTKSFRDVGKGIVKFKRKASGHFALSIDGQVSNPDNHELLKLHVAGEFEVRGREIVQVRTIIDLNEEAKRYQDLITHNLPFIFLARFDPLPPTRQPDERVYRFGGRSYMLRYVALDDVTESSLFEEGLMIGKFFLSGRPGQPPTGLAKARMVGPNHLVFSLVIDKSEQKTLGKGE